MSLLESASTADLAGSGDASGAKLIKPDAKLSVKSVTGTGKRVPVASCRHLNPKTSADKVVQKKLENEIKKFSTPTKIVSKNQITPRKRSLTMSDIPLQLNTRYDHL